MTRLWLFMLMPAPLAWWVLFTYVPGRRPRKAGDMFQGFDGK